MSLCQGLQRLVNERLWLRMQGPSAVLQSLKVKIKVQGWLPESLTDTQIIFSLRGKAYLLTTDLAGCPAPAQAGIAGKQLSQLSYPGPAVKSREDSQDSRMCLKQGRKCRTNTGHLVLFALPIHCHKQTTGMGHQKFPEVQLTLGAEKTWVCAYAQNAFTAFSERI